jgi:hypothetical protein
MVFLPADREIDVGVAGTAGLPSEIGGKMLGISKEMTVYVNQHRVFPSGWRMGRQALGFSWCSAVCHSCRLTANFVRFIDCGSYRAQRFLVFLRVFVLLDRKFLFF